MSRIKGADGKYSKNTRWEEKHGFDKPLTLAIGGVRRGAYLFEHLLSLDICQQTMEGMVPLPWAELQAYGAVNGLVRWEMKALRDMSRSWIKGHKEGENPFSKDPDKRIPDRGGKSRTS